jgi:hypothetical protein
VLGFDDETCWSQLAQPMLHRWTAETPWRLIAPEVSKVAPDPNALACYGGLRTDAHAILRTKMTVMNECSWSAGKEI